MRKHLVTLIGSVCALFVITICAFNFNDSKLVSDQVVADAASVSNTNLSIHDISTVLTTTVQELNGAVGNSMSSNYSSSVTPDDIELITMSETDLWKLVSDGVYSSKPGAPFTSHKANLEKMQQNHGTMIEVDVWYWEDPSDDTNLNKKAVKKKFQVHDALANIFTHVFADAFNDPEKPVYDIADSSAGTWVIRGINWNDSAAPSGHAYGAAIDVNPETSIIYNGVEYGNCLDLDPLPPDKFDSVPDSHKKYQLNVDGRGFVKYFKKYGFLWGAEYKTAKSDPMHFCFLGDSNARETGQANYKEYNNVQ